MSLPPPKQEICQAFSNAASGYDAVSAVQREDAQGFYEWLVNLGVFHKRRPLVEVGCGTGHLTQHLLPHAQEGILVTDLSHSMVERCQARFGDRIKGQVIDGEELEVKPGSLVLSGWTAQWFVDPICTLRRYAENGEVALSVPIDGSFPEWWAAASEAGVKVSQHPLPVADQWLSQLPISASRVVYRRSQYPSSLHFFRALKQMGATANCHSDVGSLRRVIQAWKEPCEVTYKVLYIKI